MSKRILLTGGSGRLGTAIRRALKDFPDVECYFPTSRELDIRDFSLCAEWMAIADPDIVIHAAALANAAACECDHSRCSDVNVEGTKNMLVAADANRFIYISTDYVFDGKKGNYAEDDIPNPVNFYGFSKVAGELAVAQYPNTLILRAPFRDDPPWRYERAFVDQFTSCEFVSVRAPQIIQAALSDLLGILHIGGRRRSILEMAREAGPPSIGAVYRSNITDLELPYDTSLNDDKWLAFTAAQKEKPCFPS